MKAILQRWNFMRLLRLVLGVAILAQGVVAKDAITIGLGAAFAGMGLANVGCCSSNNCSINTRSTKTQKVHYEEMDINK